MGFCVEGNRDVGARGMGRLVAWPWVFQGVAWVQRSFHSEDGAGEKSTDLEVRRPLSVVGRYQCREPAPAAGTQSGPRLLSVPGTVDSPLLQAADRQRAGPGHLVKHL